MSNWILPADLIAWLTSLLWTLDARVQPRIVSLLVGALFAQGRRTVSRWIVAAGVSEDFKPHYYALYSLGRKTEHFATQVLRLVIRTLAPQDRLVLALDDSLSKRYGPRVEGAGMHHNPTPGRTDSKFAYGHVWVMLSWVLRHPQWGTIGLPLLAKLYIRRKDLAKIPRHYRWKFQTKLELAATLVEWAAKWLQWLQLPLWIAVDGAYAKRAFLARALKQGATVVSRLRKDAALCDLPPKRRPGQRGAPRKYGERIDLRRRAVHRQGWQRGEFWLYGESVVKTYKTFLATYRPVAGVIRVVIVKEPDGWRAWFCTDPHASVQEILETVADRGAIEQNFHDLKEVHGAGQQQLRNVWANIGAWHLLMWLFTLIELRSWNKPPEELADRTARPWDNQPRRPSHADKRNALRRELLQKTFSHACRPQAQTQEIQPLLKRLVTLVT